MPDGINGIARTCSCGKGEELRIPAAAVGFPALTLSEVRAAWFGFAIGALLVLWRLGGKARLRFIVLVLVAGTIAEPLVTAGPSASVVLLPVRRHHVVIS
jgi:O-antigen ligase